MSEEFLVFSLYPSAPFVRSSIAPSVRQGPHSGKSYCLKLFLPVAAAVRLLLSALRGNNLPRNSDEILPRHSIYCKFPPSIHRGRGPAHGVW